MTDKKIYKTEVYAVQILSDKNYTEIRPQLLDMLPAKAVQQVLRFKRSIDEQRSLIGEVMSRIILSQKTGIPAKKLEIIKSKIGKPQLDHQPDLHFNISHSGNWVVCAISPSPVGIDVEKIKEPQYRIAERYFSTSELQSLNNLPAQEKKEYFFDLWTLKESYLKMLGKGLTKSLGSFSIANNEGALSLYENSGEEQEVFLKQFPLGEGYKLSVCTKHKNYNSNIKTHTITELLELYETA